MDPKKSDAGVDLSVIVTSGFIVAIRTVYGGHRFQVRAVRNEATLVMEDDDLARAVSALRRDVERAIKNGEVKK